MGNGLKRIPQGTSTRCPGQQCDDRTAFGQRACSDVAVGQTQPPSSATSQHAANESLCETVLLLDDPEGVEVAMPEDQPSRRQQRIGDRTDAAVTEIWRGAPMKVHMLLLLLLGCIQVGGRIILMDSMSIMPSMLMISAVQALVSSCMYWARARGRDPTWTHVKEVTVALHITLMMTFANGSTLGWAAFAQLRLNDRGDDRILTSSVGNPWAAAIVGLLFIAEFIVLSLLLAKMVWMLVLLIIAAHDASKEPPAAQDSIDTASVAVLDVKKAAPEGVTGTVPMLPAPGQG